MRILLGIIIGGVIGYAIGYFGRCASGVCLLTRSPVITAAIGALLGAMIATGR
jgi:hypothetical protein